MSLELEDHAWFPNWLRRQQMEFISFAVVAFKVYEPLVGILRKCQVKYALQHWTDCCTGAAGPVHFLVAKGVSVPQIILTDKYLLPPLTPPPPIESQLVTVDLLADPIPGDGIITIFNSFHHFRFLERQRLLAQIASTKRPLLVAEITQPTLVSFLLISLTTTLVQFIVAPWVKPFSWRRMIFTYLLPINFFSITWDGWISVMRSLSANDFRHHCQLASTAVYRYQFVQVGPWWKKVYILTGQPHENNNS